MYKAKLGTPKIPTRRYSLTKQWRNTKGTNERKYKDKAMPGIPKVRWEEILEQSYAAYTEVKNERILVYKAITGKPKEQTRRNMYRQCREHRCYIQEDIRGQSNEGNNRGTNERKYKDKALTGTRKVQTIGNTRTKYAVNTKRNTWT